MATPRNIFRRSNWLIELDPEEPTPSHGENIHVPSKRGVRTVPVHAVFVATDGRRFVLAGNSPRGGNSQSVRVAPLIRSPGSDLGPGEPDSVVPDLDQSTLVGLGEDAYNNARFEAAFERFGAYVEEQD